MRESLDQWHFVIAAYAVGVHATGAVVAWAGWDMTRAERRRDVARRK